MKSNKPAWEEEIYRLTDSFLVEAKDQHGNERSLEILNQDRHLFVEKMLELLDTQKRNLLERIEKEVIGEDEACFKENRRHTNPCRCRYDNNGKRFGHCLPCVESELHYYEKAKNGLRAEQRKRLSVIKNEV